LDDKPEVILQNATPELMEQIRTLVEVTHGADLVSEGRARTTLESLFLKETQSGEVRVRKRRKRVSQPK